MSRSRGFKATIRRASLSPRRNASTCTRSTFRVGDVTSTVEVQANTVHVATDSSDRSIAIGLQQIEDTPTRGRNPVSLS